MRTLCIWDLQCFKSFPNCYFFCTFFLLRIFYSRDAIHANYGKHCLTHHFQLLSTLCFWDLQYFQSFRNSCLFCTFWLIRNLNCADSDHTSYCERCSIHHFLHCAQCVYEIYSVFKVFAIAVCFAHFGLFEISTPVRRIMLTIANIV